MEKGVRRQESGVRGKEKEHSTQEMGSKHRIQYAVYSLAVRLYSDS
jgi:CRISPR/Cas system type I-B associated protein Csh2 (Cas7 group RAMP superfamily)